MIELETPAVKTYDDLLRTIEDSGRPHDLARIEKAYRLAEKAHGDTRRLSGELYISHPVAVA